MIDDGLDHSYLNELIALGPVEGLVLVRDLIEIFFAEVPARMDQMRRGLMECDCGRVLRAAHAMRGGAGNLGAVGLASLCDQVEQQAGREEPTGLGLLLDAMEVELIRVDHALAQRLAMISRAVTQ